MLPNSVFSTSTLKQTKDNDTSQNESSFVSKKRQYYHISSDSSSESDSESDQELKASYTQLELQQEISLYTKKLEHQFLKQKIFMEKNKIAARRIRDLNKKLAKLSQMAIDPILHISSSSSSSSPTLKIDKGKEKEKVEDKMEDKMEIDEEVELDELDEDDLDQPLFQLQSSSTTPTPSSNSSSKLVNENPSILREEVNGKKKGSINSNHNNNDSNNHSKKNNNNSDDKKNKRNDSTVKSNEIKQNNISTITNDKNNNDKNIQSTSNNNNDKNIQSTSNNNNTDNNTMNLLNPLLSASAVKKNKKDKHDQYQITIGQSDHYDRFVLEKEFIDKKSLTRKPRSLLLNRGGAATNKYTKELLVATTLDGELQFINTETRESIKTLESNLLYKDSWIEDLCWASPHTLALAPATKTGQPNDYSITLIDINAIDRRNIEGKIQQLFINPHEKPYNTIVPCNIGKQNNRNKTTFLTAGEDKAVYLWDLKRDRNNKQWGVESTVPIKITHTSRINTLLYDNHTNRIYSGGSDKRFIYYDIQTEKQVSERRLSSAVHQVMQSRTTPNLFLVCEASPEKQFNIYDQRCPEFTSQFALQFGCRQDAFYSRYVTPDWNDNGYTIVCGSQTHPKLNFWDIRYNKVLDGPSFEIPVEGKTKILPAVFIPRRNTVVSVSSSRILSWIDYSIEREKS